MNLTETQRAQVKQILEKCKQIEYNKSNKVVENAIQEWQENKKTDKEAYNKIYKKVIKNEHHIVQRYAQLDDEKRLRTLAEVFVDDIVDILDFEELDQQVRKKVLEIAGIQK